MIALPLNKSSISVDEVEPVQNLSSKSNRRPSLLLSLGASNRYNSTH
jgi:hypothetical protein